jgi:succinate dehydrogenase/fumarate reductase-like Fe-S protein
VDTFKIEFELGQSVLGLQMVRQDSSLAFRFSCINANACKECMMLIDGEVEYPRPLFRRKSNGMVGPPCRC